MALGEQWHATRNGVVSWQQSNTTLCASITLPRVPCNALWCGLMIDRSMVAPLLVKQETQLAALPRCRLRLRPAQWISACGVAN